MESKNEGLQVGRAIAALSVAYFHSYTALRGFPETAQHPIMFLKEWGFLGVNLFFAISGYVISLVLTRRPDLYSFTVKRLFRLYPIYWLAMACVAILIALGKYRQEPIGHFLYSMTLLPQPGASAYDVSWTLERELVFYVVAAVSIRFAGLIGLAVVLFLLAWAGLKLGNPWSFHLLSTMQADFLGGVLVFIANQHARPNQIGSIALLISGAALLLYTRTHDFTFSVTISFILLMYGLTNVKLPWHSRPLSWIIKAGDASYSIYLWHSIIFILSSILIGHLHLPAWMCEPARYLMLGACVLISLVSWRLIELPFIALGSDLASSKQNRIKLVTD